MKDNPKQKLNSKDSGVFVVVAIIAAITVFLTSFFDRTPFLNAVKSGDVAEVQRLISENPNLIHSSTPLILAVKSDNNNVVAILIEAGADVNAKGDSRTTPLHWAAFYGNTPITEMLLKAGANINAIGFRHNNTPLQVAAAHGHAEIVKLLLAHGANAAAQDMLGKTALQIAEENHYTNVIAVLINPVPLQGQEVGPHY